jgi:hypothetical protein
MARRGAFHAKFVKSFLSPPRGRPRKPNRTRYEVIRRHYRPGRVMAGLVPAIHAAPLQKVFGVVGGGAAWIPGTRPGMTASRNGLAATDMSVK